MSDNLNTKVDTVLLPCLRGQVEDWVYYVTLMTYKEVSLRFKLATEIHKNKSLNDLLQRALTKRATEIGDYVLRQRQHFFNAIIAGIYEGEPKWIEVNFTQTDQSQPKPTELSGAVGALQLSGLEKIFAIDGQHRLEGIKDALARSNKHSAEEIPVIFIAHNNSKVGLERTRRLFSTLNRYAKPVTLGEIIALDEDDAIAILTRRHLYHHPLLSQEDVILAAKTKALPKGNTISFTTIQTLYDFLDKILLGPKEIIGKKNREYKMHRKSDLELNVLYKNSVEWIDAVIKTFPELDEYSKMKGQNRATKFRNKDGGSLLFRPVGLTILGEALSTAAIKKVGTQNEILNILQKVKRDLGDKPWVGILYDSTNKRMRRASKGDIQLCANLWLYLGGLGGKTPDDSLVSEYAGALNVTRPSASKMLSNLRA